MIIYFVRHGDPDYQNDCLTPLGRKQAERAAERLSAYGIEHIFSSPKGRAMETAEYTAKLLNKEIIQCDYMRELGWKSLNEEPILANGHPWRVAKHFASEGISLADYDWRSREPYSKSMIVERVGIASTGFDGLLADFGYRREGDFYRVVGSDTDTKIAMFSHAGSSSAVLSHLFNIPFPIVCGSMPPDVTSITTVSLSNKIDSLVCPRLQCFNDAMHIYGINIEREFES